MKWLGIGNWVCISNCICIVDSQQVVISSLYFSLDWFCIFGKGSLCKGIRIVFKECILSPYFTKRSIYIVQGKEEKQIVVQGYG